MTSYHINLKAYTKVAFHAAKYPSRPVNGVFLGRCSSESHSVEIEDSVPLLHHWTSLSPTMEIGLSLAATHASSVGLEVVGYYQAADHVNDMTLVPVGEKVASAVREQCPQAIACVVDGFKLVSGESALLLYLPQGSSNSWRPAADSSLIEFAQDDIPSRVQALIKSSRTYLQLGDFDDHLEDVSIDWLRNPDCSVEA